MASAKYMQSTNATDSERNLTNLFQKKLKRKNLLSVSLTSFNDIVNQEKRTKMETIEKLVDQNNDNVSVTEKKTNIRKDINGSKITVDKKVLTKPPLPPSRLIHKNFTSPANTLTPALKRKLEENSLVLQKLNAQIDQIRLKNVDLKASLGSERSALRTLRVQQEADIQKWKTKVKKLQTILEATKKLAALNRTQNSKDAMSNGNEKSKDADFRKLNDSYVIRLNQLSKSAKTEICRLLEELKKKERYIGILRKELQIQNDNKSTKPQKRTNSRIVQDPIEMKKLKDIEQRNKLKLYEINSNKKINNCYINSTCDEKDFDSMSHEITERILIDHNDDHDECKSNDFQNSDCDSALSSISPQPPAEDSDAQANIWKTLNNYSKDLKNLQKENDIVRLENDNLRKKLDIATQKIGEFALLENNINNAEKTNNDQIQQLLEKIKCLQSKESNLEQELHDIREQNELLEFRIIEVEESNDKWSLQSNPMYGSKNVNPDIEEESDGITTLINDCSDFGVFSPNSNDLMDELGFSHCNNSNFNNLNNKELNQGLSEISQKPSIDNKDRLCLQQAIKLIQSLDMMSHTNSNLDLTKSNTFEVRSSLRSTDYSNNPLQKFKLSSARVVATVSPYNSYCSSTSSDCSRKTCSNLTESGIFDESSELQCRSSKYTQTHLEDFGSATENPATKDLCAEIQRLNKFREKIEECVNKSGSTNNISSNVTGGPTNHSPNLTDQKRLQYYEERVEILEGKLLIYESSGDIQTKRLAARLQKEVQLENSVKDLREQLDLLIIEKNNLEEEKCEFEEAENDTRLRLQRLEVDLEILNQRNIELEMSRDSVQNKLKESQSQCASLHEELIDCHEKVEVYKEQNNELNTSIKFLKKSLPALVLLNAFMVVGGNQCGSSDSKQSDSNKCNEKNSPNTSVQVCNNNCNNNCTNNELIVANLQKELHQIRCREQDLRKTITMLEGAYQETIENADCFWAQIEKSYEKQLAEAEAKENCLKSKVNQLEERLKCDESAAHEKISQLEETETELRCLLSKITKENRDLGCELNSLRKELKCTQEALQNVEKASDGPKELLEIEKKKGEALLEEVRYIKKLFCDAERHHNEDIKDVKCELIRASKELQQLEITNAELKEEVGCFENQIKKMDTIRKEDSDKIRCLQDELADKIEQCAKIQKRLSAKSSGNSPCAFSANKCSQQSLAQELNGSSESPSKKMKRTEVKDLPTAAVMLGQTLEFTKINCPKNKAIQDFSKMAENLKSLADSIVKKDSKNSPNGSDENKRESQSRKSNADKGADGGNNGANGDDDGGDDGGDIGGVDGGDDGGDVGVDDEGVNEINEVTVGMALVPHRPINFRLPTKPLFKSPIMEVPSELRKPKNTPYKPVFKPVTTPKQIVQSKSTGEFRVMSSLKTSFQKFVGNFFDHNDENKAIVDPKITQIHDNVIFNPKTLTSDNNSDMFTQTTELPIALVEPTQDKIETSPQSITPIQIECKNKTELDSVKRMELKNCAVQSTLQIDSSPEMANEVDAIKKYFTQKKISNYDQNSNNLKEKVSNSNSNPNLNRIEKKSQSKKINYNNCINSSLTSKKLNQTPVAYLEIATSTSKSDPVESKVSDIQLFIYKLRFSVNSKYYFDEVEKKLKDRYDSDESFKIGVNLTVKVFFDSNDKESKYEPTAKEIKKIHSILKIVQKLSYPIVIPMLQTIETEITQKLLSLPTSENNSKIYCAVYYPVARKGSKYH